MALRLLLLRHAETDWNREGRYQGWTDTDLSELGRGQAEAASRLLARQPLAAVWSSPLRRARDTAAAIAGALSRWASVFMRCSAVQSGRNSSSEMPVDDTWSDHRRSSPSASTPERMARASRSWRLNTLASPSASSMRSTSRSPTTMDTAGVKCASFLITALCSAAMSK